MGRLHTTEIFVDKINVDRIRHKKQKYEKGKQIKMIVNKIRPLVHEQSEIYTKNTCRRSNNELNIYT